MGSPPDLVSERAGEQADPQAKDNRSVSRHTVVNLTWFW